MTVEDPWGEYPDVEHDEEELWEERRQTTEIFVPLIYADAEAILVMFEEMTPTPTLIRAMESLKYALYESEMEDDRFTGYDDHLATEP